MATKRTLSSSELLILDDIKRYNKYQEEFLSDCLRYEYQQRRFMRPIGFTTMFGYSIIIDADNGRLTKRIKSWQQK